MNKVGNLIKTHNDGVYPHWIKLLEVQNKEPP